MRIGAQSVGHPVYIVGRLFAYYLGLKDPRFVTGYKGPEIDIALMGGELDARAGTGETILLRTPDWLEKGLIDVHAGIEIPKGIVRSIPRDTETTELFKLINGTSHYLPTRRVSGS